MNQKTSMPVSLQSYDYQQQQLIQLETAFQQKQTEIDILQSLLQEKEQAFAQQLVVAEEVNNVLQADVALLQTKIVRLNVEIDSKQSELVTLQERIQELEQPKPVAVAIQKRPIRDILNEIQKVASWGGQSEQADIEQLTQEIKRDYPDKLSEVRKVVSVGKNIKVGLDELYKLANELGKNSNPAQTRFQRFAKDFPYLRDKAESQLEKGESARKRRQAEIKAKKSGEKITSVVLRQTQRIDILPTAMPTIKPESQLLANAPQTSGHPRDIRNLTASSRWYFVVDETGSVFSQEEAQNLSSSDTSMGRWVGLLLPEQNHGLTNLSDWHAVDKSLPEIDNVVQRVLDANVGIFGLSVQQMPLTIGEQWATGVLSLIDWVLRLVPLEGGMKTSIHVQIENRDSFIKGMEWAALASDALRRLSLAYPDRAALIDLSIKIIDKNGSPFNGYVDALAFTWGSPKDHSKERLKATQLLGTCFLQGDAHQIMQAWEWLERGITIRAADWYQLLDQPDAKLEGSLTATILERLGENCCSNVPLWRSFLDETRLHLDSKAIRLNALGKQIDWLNKYCPENEKMPSRLRLLWFTSKLAHANHLGKVEKSWMSEMQSLADQLIDEDAPLVCWADLHLAVNATNTYNFALASTYLTRWEEMPCNVAGLRYAGQIQSSFGQHAAFMLQAEKAKQHFTNALQLFGKLSDAEQKQKEMTQTATYLAIVEIDHGDEQAARQAVEVVLNSPIEAMIESLAKSATESEKYKHHLLLRWLVYHGSKAEQQHYLAQQEHWQSSFGHPWALIQLYRAVLLQKSDTTAAIELALDGYSLTTEVQQGATVRLIGFCCRAVTLAWGDDWEDALTELDKLETQLPAAKTHLDKLREYLNAPEKPLEMLKTVLPFNFH